MTAPTGPARILRHGGTYTATDAYGVVLDRHPDASRLAIRVAVVHGIDVIEEPLMQFAEVR